MTEVIKKGSRECEIRSAGRFTHDARNDRKVMGIYGARADRLSAAASKPRASQNTINKYALTKRAALCGCSGRDKARRRSKRKRGAKKKRKNLKHRRNKTDSLFRFPQKSLARRTLDPYFVRRSRTQERVQRRTGTGSYSPRRLFSFFFFLSYFQ